MDKEALFSSRLEEEDVDVPGVGTVRVRALSREQALQVRGVSMEQTELERKLLAWAMVDPPLSQKDVRRWQQASGAGEIEKVTNVIIRLSGMEEAADKAAYKSAGE